ncbi:MAG: cohesin domain-containing protein [Planctomycetota bacterium]
MFSLKRETVVVGLVTLVCLGGAARGGLIVRFDTPERTVGLGDVFTIDILADVGDPLVGWGFDLSFDPSILSLVDSPAIGPRWIPASAPDGDGLAGLAFPDSVSGAGVRLASVTFSAVTLGETGLTMSTTAGDLTEGFALDPTGFAQAVFESAHVFVVPEPATGLLCAIVLSIIGLRARRWGR